MYLNYRTFKRFDLTRSNLLKPFAVRHEIIRWLRSNFSSVRFNRNILMTTAIIALYRYGKRILTDKRGFTWIELIVVVMLIGIIGMVVGRSLLRSDTELAAQSEVVKAHLRYAQSRSINTESVWYLQFAGGSYSLYKYGDATPKRLPGADSSVITLPGGISITAGTVSFDNWGRPCTDSAGQTAQISDRTLTVSDGSSSRTIDIAKNTGFIP